MVFSLPRRLAPVVLAVGLLAPGASCTALGLDSATSQRSLLERQKARWTRLQISSYRFTYDVSCLCEAVGAPVEIEVHSSLITWAAYAGGAQPLPDNLHAGLPTIDDLFAVIERALVDRANLLEVSYHPTMGYPTRIAVDRSFNVAADEVVHVISSLTPLGPG